MPMHDGPGALSSPPSFPIPFLRYVPVSQIFFRPVCHSRNYGITRSGAIREGSTVHLTIDFEIYLFLRLLPIFYPKL